MKCTASRLPPLCGITGWLQLRVLYVTFDGRRTLKGAYRCCQNFSRQRPSYAGGLGEVGVGGLSVVMSLSGVRVNCWRA